MYDTNYTMWWCMSCSAFDSMASVVPIRCSTGTGGVIGYTIQIHMVGVVSVLVHAWTGNYTMLAIYNLIIIHACAVY